MSHLFSAWLDEQMKDRRWTQGDLARALGVSQPFVSRLLSEDKQPSIEFCLKLGEEWGIPPESILRIAGYIPAINENDKVQQIVEIIRHLSEEEQTDLLDYARFKYQKRKRK